MVELNESLIIRGIYTIYYQEKSADFIFPGETHDFWELIYMDRGYAYLLIEDKGYKISEGDLFFFDRNQNHIVWSDDTTAPCFLTISFEMSFHESNYFRYKRFKADPDIRELFRRILAERLNAFEGSIHSNIGVRKGKDGAVAEQLIKIYLTEVLLKLYRQEDTALSCNIHSEIIKAKSENIILRKCMDYISEHINEKLFIEQISQCIPVSSSYLNRLFKRHTGFPVIDYVNNMKLDKAKEMIRASELNMTEISESLGFSSIHYFSRIFKKKFGISPRIYSKSIKS